jgi:hypothetical protein
MTQGQSRAGAGRARRYPAARLALVALLIVIAAAALRGGLPRLALDGRYTGDELAIAAVLEAIVVSLLIVILVRRARAPRDQLIAARLREVLRTVLIAMSVAVPAGYLLTRTVRSHPVRRVRQVQRTVPGLGPFRLPAHMSHWLFVFATVADILLLTLVFAAIVTGLVLLARRLRWRRLEARLQRAAISEFSAEDPETELRKAVEYGWLALRELDDARGAIIACYLAMEQSLAQAGTARGAAETPDELLARAAGSGLVRGAAAARLTEVFYEARFSSRPLAQPHRDAAEQALAEIAASLSETAR